MARTQNSETREKYLSLGLTALLHGVNHAMYNMLMPLGLTIARYFKTEDLSQITLGFTLYLMCYGFGHLPVGIISDFLPRKAMLAAGAIINGVAIAFVALFPGYHFFLAGLATAGIGAAVYHPVGAAYLSELFRDNKGMALGISGIGASVGLAIAPIVSGIICKSFGWQKTFLAFAAFALISAAFFIMFAKEEKTHHAAAGESPAGKGWSMALAGFLAFAALVFTFREFTGWGGFYIIPVYAEKLLHYDVRGAGFISGLQSLGGFLAQPLAGWLSDKLGRRKPGMILMAFIALAMIMIPHVRQGLLLPVVFFYSMVYSATVPILDAIIADRTPARIRGTVFGLFLACGIGLSSFAPIIQARILDAGRSSHTAFIYCFGLLAATSLVAAILLFFFKKADVRNPV